MSQILRRFYGQAERRESAERVAAATRESRGWPDSNQQTATYATLAGDEKRLRGLPAVARGVSGASPGTDPLGALMAKQPR